MPKKKKSAKNSNKAKDNCKPQIKLQFARSFWKDYKKIDNTHRKEIRGTLTLLQENGFTPGMHLRPLPQERSIQYIKAAGDIHITLEISYEESITIVMLRRIRKHDTLHLNP